MAISDTPVIFDRSKYDLCLGWGKKALCKGFQNNKSGYCSVCRTANCSRCNKAFIPNGRTKASNKPTMCGDCRRDSTNIDNRGVHSMVPH